MELLMMEMSPLKKRPSHGSSVVCFRTVLHPEKAARFRLVADHTVGGPARVLSILHTPGECRATGLIWLCSESDPGVTGLLPDGSRLRV